MQTGILGENDQLKGLKWDRVKIRAMLEDAPDEYVIVRAFYSF